MADSGAGAGFPVRHRIEEYLQLFARTAARQHEMESLRTRFPEKKREFEAALTRAQALWDTATRNLPPEIVADLRGKLVVVGNEENVERAHAFFNHA